MNNPKPRFTGIFIPVEILQRTDLTTLEMLLLSWIDALYCDIRGGCFASNEYLASRLQVKENTIAKSLTKLRSLGLIEDVHFDGRIRVIRATLHKAVDESQSKSALDLNPTQDVEGWIKIQPSIGEKSNIDKSLNQSIKPPTPLKGEALRAGEFDSGKEKPTSKKNSNEAKTITDLLVSHIMSWNPKFKSPNLECWYRDADRMLKLDGRQYQDILDVIDWVSKDLFWRANIMSISKLRKQFDILQAKMISHANSFTSQNQTMNPPMWT